MLSGIFLGFGLYLGIVTSEVPLLYSLVVILFREICAILLTWPNLQSWPKLMSPYSAWFEM